MTAPTARQPEHAWQPSVDGSGNPVLVCDCGRRWMPWQTKPKDKCRDSRGNR